MSNPVQSVRPNDILLMQNQVLNAREMLHRLSREIPVAMQRISLGLASHHEWFTLLPDLRPTGALIQIRETLEQALAEYSALQRECSLLKFQTDRLLSSMYILVGSPASFDEATELVRNEDEIMERFDQGEECNQNLLISLDDSTHALAYLHMQRESR